MSIVVLALILNIWIRNRKQEVAIFVALEIVKEYSWTIFVRGIGRFIPAFCGEKRRL